MYCMYCNVLGLSKSVGVNYMGIYLLVSIGLAIPMKSKLLSNAQSPRLEQPSHKYKLYPNLISIEEHEGNYICRDKDTNQISIDMDAVNTKATELQAEHDLKQKTLLQKEFESLVFAKIKFYLKLNVFFLSYRSDNSLHLFSLSFRYFILKKPTF